MANRLCDIYFLSHRFFIMDLPKRKQKCYNCKHAGKQFKVVGKTYLHCEHPKWQKKHEESEYGLSAWDTLCEWWDTCSDFEPKDSLNGG